MTYPFALTCTFITRTKTGTDALGNAVYSDAPVASVPGCLFAPGGSSETLGNQDTVVDQPVLYVPTGSPIPAVIDAVSVPGMGTFEVDGGANQWPANGTAYSIVIPLRQVVG